MLETRTVQAGRSPLTVERARALLLSREAAEVLGRSTRLAAVALRVPIATLGVPDAAVLRLPAQVGVPHPWSAARAVPIQSVPCRQTLELDEPLAVERLDCDPRTRDDLWLEAFPRTSYLGLCLRVNGVPVAVLSVSDVQPRRWTEDEVALLSDVCAVIIRDLEQLGGVGERPPVRSDAPESAEVLREHMAQWRALLEESGTGSFVSTLEGRVLDCNRAALRILGYAAEGVHDLKVQDLYADPRERADLHRDILKHGQVSERPLQLCRADGSTVCCSVTVSARRSAAGELLGFQGIFRDVSAQQAAEQQLVQSAFHDPLTGLPNRALLLDRLERLLKHSKRRAGYRYGVLFIDLDRFKLVNDTHGHQMGDRLLRDVARRLERCVRQEDTVARIGGDEFAIVLDGIGDAAGVIQVAERIINELGQPYDDAAQNGIGASIGIALSMTGYDTVDEVLRDADTAMYRAKSTGRGGFAVFDTEMYARVRAQLQLEAELREALGRNQLALHYHPVVAIDGGAVTGMEALVRWSHPERGILLPEDFMPLAERTGLILDIGWWVLREACRQLRCWQAEYPATAVRLTMNVNLSARQFLHPELVQKLDAILDETGLDPHQLRLDLKEAVVMQDPELAARLLAQLGERGVQICIDDFGTGYSSLQDLRDLPISGIKIAPRFVHELEREGGSRAVVQTIIALGQSMAIEAIAEGVETPEQLEQLRALGTRFAQGFLFSLPLDPEKARALLAN